MDEGRRGEQMKPDDCKQLPLPGPWVGYTFTLTFMSHTHTQAPYTHTQTPHTHTDRHHTLTHT